MTINLRPIRQTDNSKICDIIKTVLTELGFGKKGTAFADAEILDK